MAGIVNSPALGINFKQNKLEHTAGFGKYYPEVDRQKTISTRGFAEHMIAHGSKYQLEDIQAILRMFSTCLPELLAMGIGVKFDGLGIFMPYAEAKKGITKAEMADVNPRDVVKAIHIRFIPDSTKLDDLSGPAFADRCSLELRNVVIVDTVKDPQTNKLVERLRTLVPIDTFLSDNYSGVSGNGGTTPGGSGPGSNGGVTPGEAGNGDDEGE
jgi:predicted histone-like DNA-binding protein